MSVSTDLWARQLSEANDAMGAARDVIAACRSVKSVNDAYEDLEFWSNKKAFVTAALIGERLRVLEEQS